MIETERLLLREYTLEDFDALYEIMSDSETMQHYPAPFDEARTRRWIEWNLDNYAQYGFGLWAVVLKETGEFIGDCGITMQNIDGESLPEIGYHIHKKYWRRGYAKEAAKAVRDWAFENTDYPSLYSYCKYTNEASYKTAEAIGMHFEKEYPDEANKITRVSVIHRADTRNQLLDRILESAKKLYGLQEYKLSQVPEHEGGRNLVYVCLRDGEPQYILRLSVLGDRTMGDYLAEAEFVHYLAEKGAPVSAVIPSLNSNLVEAFSMDKKECYAILFSFAKGMLISDNGYRYRDGAPLEEYFYNTGKALGAIHRLSKEYTPKNRRPEFFHKYNREFIDALIPDSYEELKKAIGERLESFCNLPVNADVYGLIHFDFSDGNYHIDMNTGDITVFDFDNCMYCWYMFDLANLWIHGTGWFQNESDATKRMEGMKSYFDTVMEGYKSETDIFDEELSKLQLFIDMVLIENIVDEFECSAREGEELDPEDIEDAASCLINRIPYAGFGA